MRQPTRAARTQLRLFPARPQIQQCPREIHPRAAQITLQGPAKPVRARGKKKSSVKDECGKETRNIYPYNSRWPRSEVKAAKLAAVQGDYDSVSEFRQTGLGASNYGETEGQGRSNCYWRIAAR